jgi:hypothetical protein
MAQEQVNKPGKPWTNHGKYATFTEADGIRTKLKEGANEHFQCKIYRKHDGFLVKIRDNTPEEPKKKSKKKNKKEKVDNG